MKVEEAIEAISEILIGYHFPKLEQVNDLLKRGEKFEKMWEEVIEEYGEYVIRTNYENKPLCARMETIKKKYFPKGAQL
jgi:hypothetical protein